MNLRVAAAHAGVARRTCGCALGFSACVASWATESAVGVHSGSRTTRARTDDDIAQLGMPVYPAQVRNPTRSRYLIAGGGAGRTCANQSRRGEDSDAPPFLLMQSA